MSPVNLFGALLVVLTAALLSSAADPQRRQFVVGSNATLQCSWSGLRDQELIRMVRWFRRGVRLRSKRYTFDNDGRNYTITINNIQKKDKGTYICSPKLDVDMVLEDGKFLVEVVDAVLPEAPEMTETTLTEGSGGYFSCNFTAAKEKHNLELYWSRNGEIFMDESGNVAEDSKTRYTTSTDKMGVDWINLTYVDKEAAGIYSCNYEYPDGRLFAMTFNISIEEREDPDDYVRNMTMREDWGSGRVMCNVSSLASQMERFYWEKDGMEITESEKYTMTETSENFYTLKVNMLDAEQDEGVYRCVAQLHLYSLAVRFNVTVVKSTKNTDFTGWTDFSVCDKQGKKYRFRTCAADGCLDKYGYVYEVDSEICNDDDDDDDMIAVL